MDKQVLPFLFEYHRAKLMSYRERIIPDFETAAESDRILGMREYSQKVLFWQYGINWHELNVLMNPDESIMEKTCREYDLVERELIPKDIDLYEDLLHKYIEAIDGVVMDDGLSFIFYGHNGSGKTMAAVHTLCSAIERGLNGYYITFKDLMNLHNNAEFGREDVESRVYEHVMHCDMLVIDEVGKESKVTENVLGVFEQVVKNRVSEVRPTIMVSNIPVHKVSSKTGNNMFLERYGNSVFSALLSNYRALLFSKHGKFRQRTRKEWNL